MRFMFAGEPLDLTAEEVRAAAADIEPQPIRIHMVDIDGRWFPPKQLIRAATERQRGFSSHEALRVLEKLKFTCRRTDETAELSAPAPVSEERILVLEAAVAGLHARLVAAGL
jgi:hypothetical protein